MPTLERPEPPAVMPGASSLKMWMSRDGFHVALIKVAVQIFVVTGEVNDVSDALDRLLSRLSSRAPTHLALDPNEFRTRHAYLEPVCDVLAVHEATLRDVFARLSKPSAVAASGEHTRPRTASPPRVSSPSRGSSTSGASSPSRASRAAIPTLSAEQWVQGVRAFGLLGDDLTEADALRSFAWSRMGIPDPFKPFKRGGRDGLLCFECFLELVCHLACLKALPTDEEIADAGARDAGSYSSRQKLDNRAAFARFCKERARPWAAEPPTDLAKRLEHTISWLGVCVLEGGGRGE